MYPRNNPITAIERIKNRRQSQIRRLDDNDSTQSHYANEGKSSALSEPTGQVRVEAWWGTTEEKRGRKVDGSVLISGSRVRIIIREESDGRSEVAASENYIPAVFS